MADRDTWTALAERCEAAKEPDRKIDAGIMTALGFDWVGVIDHGAAGRKGGTIISKQKARFTDSTDAILALIKQELLGFKATVCSAGWAILFRPRLPDEESNFECGEAATPALALCAAFCRVKAEVG